MGPEVHINSKINTETHLHCIIQTEEEKKKKYFSVFLKHYSKSVEIFIIRQTDEI